jgi:hypothetical protein
MFSATATVGVGVGAAEGPTDEGEPPQPAPTRAALALTMSKGLKTIENALCLATAECERAIVIKRVHNKDRR